MLVSLYNKLVSALSHQQGCCLCLLDISVAFDTIDHSILLQRFPLGSVSLALLYSGSSPICPLDPSLLKPAATHLNPSHTYIVFLKSESWARSFFILYRPTTPLNHLIESSS